MKQQKKFNSGLEASEIIAKSQVQNGVQEFASVEELLRHDAAGTTPPASIEQRLQKSSAGLPKPNRSWWQRLFQR